MTNTPSPRAAGIDYPRQTLKRAARALACSPFRLKLLEEMRSRSVSLREITDDRGIYNGFTRRPMADLMAEDELMWLIAVGLLRREVDGQGLTDSFRLTPLGRQLLAQIGASSSPDLRPSLQDHLYNSLSRWLRVPAWLQ